MKNAKHLWLVLIWACWIGKAWTQTTTTSNITAYVKLTNPYNEIVDVEICPGRLFNDLECEEKCQTLSAHKVIDTGIHIRKERSCWVITLQAKEVAKVNMELRCANKGFDLRTKEPHMAVTSQTFLDTTALKASQPATWTAIEKIFNTVSEKDILEGISSGPGNQCEVYVKEAIFDLFEQRQLTTLDPDFEVSPILNPRNCSDYDQRKQLLLKDKMTDSRITLSNIQVRHRYRASRDESTVIVRCKVSVDLQAQPLVLREN